MIKKSYKANSLSEAIALIKKELGPKAAILSTKKIPEQRRLFKKIPAMVIVDASVDERYLTQEQLDALSMNKQTEKSKLVSKVKSAEKKRQLKEKGDVSDEEGVMVSLSQDSKIVTLLKKLEALESERDELKRELEKRSEYRERTVIEVQESEKHFTIELLEQHGCHKSIIDAWQEQLNAMPQNLTEEECLEQCCQFIASLASSAEKKKLPRVLAFVGPSGSGKTSVTLKLAYDLKKNHKKKIAVFTLNGDLGVTEHMEYFCHQNGISFCVVHQMRTFSTQVQEFKDYDHILIDTESFVPHDESELNVFLDKIQKMQAEVCCVLSAKDFDNDFYLAGFPEELVQHVVFTKLDEVFTIGPMLNAIVTGDLHVSYYSTGESLQDDFVVGDPDVLVSAFLKTVSFSGLQGQANDLSQSHGVQAIDQLSTTIPDEKSETGKSKVLKDLDKEFTPLDFQ